MTRRANARLAGLLFLLYIVTGLASMVLFRHATGGAEGSIATLASLARHPTGVRLTALLTLLTFFDAVALAVALYALTRDQDPDLALLALCCRMGEGVIGAMSAVRTLELVSVATASTAAAAPDMAAAQALGGLLLQGGGSSTLVGATCFAVGSTLFAWLFLRARSIPVPLASLGLFASILLVLALPLRLAGFLRGPVTYYVWIPMALFEVVLALWLLIKGVGAPGTRALHSATSP
jgi:Domain of unknown function (DUF4386)